MNQDSPKLFQVNLSSASSWLTLIAVIWLLGMIGLGWLVKSFLVLVGLLFLAPVVAFVGFRWWLKRSLVADQCPVCSYQFTGLNQTQFQCPSCGETLRAEKNHFQRLTVPGTIDVEAVEVSVQKLED